MTRNSCMKTTLLSIAGTYTNTCKLGRVHTLKPGGGECNKALRSHFVKIFPQRHTITWQLCLTCCKSASISISHQNHNHHGAPSCHFHFLPSVKQKIICTLSPTSTRTSNFPLLIQPCAPHTSVRYNRRRRGHAETSIKGS